MNLCGGITSLTENELMLQIQPAGIFTATHTPTRNRPDTSSSSSHHQRNDILTSIDNTTNSLHHGSNNNNSSSTSSSSSPRVRGDGGVELNLSGITKTITKTTPINTSATTTTKSKESSQIGLNPVSQDDMAKMMLLRQQRNNNSSSSSILLPPVVTMTGLKSSTMILMKKLESGFNVVWLDKEGLTTTTTSSNNNKQQAAAAATAVNISTNSDKTVLRIRNRSSIVRDENDNENNDGTTITKSSNHYHPHQGDIRLKIKYIAKVGSEKDKTTTPSTEFGAGGEATSGKPTSFFVIKMKQSVGEREKFKFDAESVAERDTIVLAIRHLMEQAKVAAATTAPSSSYKVVGEDGHPRQQHHESSSAHTRGESHGVSGIPNEKSTRSSRRIDKESTTLDGNTTATANATNCSNQRDAGLQEQHPPPLVADESNVSFDELKDPLLFSTLGCHATNCHSEAALAAVADGELASFAANQLSGPWCTDDLCTASLHDLANSMKGIFDLKKNFKPQPGMHHHHHNASSTPGTSKNQNQQQQQQHYGMAQQYLPNFLGGGDTCTTTGPISELLSVRELWTTTNAANNNLLVVKPEKRFVHNRAQRADGKALRLKHLRTQMTFQSGGGKDGGKHIAFLQTACSFDDIHRSGKWERRKHQQSPILLIAGQMDASSYLDHTLDKDDAECCYDSDPEGARERTLRQGPRRAMAEMKNSVTQREPTHREALDILGSNRFGLGRKWRRRGEEIMLDIIEATKNETFTLMWHPIQTSKSSTTGLPLVTCVKLWIEAGIYLVDGTFLLPKLTWLPVHEKHLHARILNTSKESPGKVDLLDICRVKECVSMDRDVFPFAHVDRSFIIQTQGTKFLFETQSKQERGRIVNGLKLVIARLASLLMLRDLRAVDEFFGGTNSVPGEAPDWARSEKLESTDEFPEPQFG